LRVSGKETCVRFVLGGKRDASDLYREGRDVSDLQREGRVEGGGAGEGGGGRADAWTPAPT